MRKAAHFWQTALSFLAGFLLGTALRGRKFHKRVAADKPFQAEIDHIQRNTDAMRWQKQQRNHDPKR